MKQTKTYQKSKRAGIKLRRRTQRRLKLALVPHRNNQYRPHLVRRYGILVVALAIFTLQGGYNLATSGTVLGTESNIKVDQLVSDTNKARAESGLGKLRLNKSLSAAATDKAKDMFKHQYWAHVSPDGTTPWHWFEKEGYGYAYAGENLAKNFASSGATMAAWMASPKHRDNIMNKHYSDVGFAIEDGELEGKPTTLVVALYGSPDDKTVLSSRPLQIGGSASAAAVNGAVDAPIDHSMSAATRLGVAFESLTPAALVSVMVMVLVAGVAMFAHLYRRKLPMGLRKSWYRHHGLIKAGAMASLCLVVLFLYSGGQI